MRCCHASCKGISHAGYLVFTAASHPINLGNITMKIMSCLITVALILCSYTTLAPVELSQTTLQKYISAGDLSHSGDKVKVTPTERTHGEFTDITVMDGYIKGEDVGISTKDPALIEKLEINQGGAILFTDISLAILIVSATECAPVSSVIINNGAQN